MAGVSKGTVDRVLHNRGKVSKIAFEKVDKVLKEIDYRPNPIARNLKRNKIYRIDALLPDPKLDPYWIPVNEGVIEAANEFASFGILVTKHFYNPNNRISFSEQSQKIVASKPDALLTAPIYRKESQALLKSCCEHHIMSAIINNLLDSMDRHLFIGQDLNQSGRVAASLMDKLIDRNDHIAIIHINREPHMKVKESGFKDYFMARPDSKLTITSKKFNSTEKKGFATDVSQFLENNPKISAFFVTNSKAHMLVEALLELNKKDAIIIGYDLLAENITFLREGKINFLIHQKPKRQAYLSVSHLAEHFLFGKPFPPQEFLPIDIITTENVHYYL